MLHSASSPTAKKEGQHWGRASLNLETMYIIFQNVFPSCFLIYLEDCQLSVAL